MLRIAYHTGQYYGSFVRLRPENEDIVSIQRLARYAHIHSSVTSTRIVMIRFCTTDYSRVLPVDDCSVNELSHFESRFDDFYMEIMMSQQIRTCLHISARLFCESPHRISATSHGGHNMVVY